MIHIYVFEDIAYANSLCNKLIANKKIDNIKTIDFSNKEMNPISELHQIDLFNTIQAYKIMNCTFLNTITEFKKQQSLIECLNAIEADIFMFCHKKLIPEKNIKETFINYEIKDVTKITTANKNKMVLNTINLLGIKYNSEMLTHFCNKLPPNYSIIQNELKKVANLQKATDNIGTLMQIVCDYNNENIFELLELLLFNNQKSFWIKFYNLIDQQQIEAITLINTMYAQLINIYFFNCLAQHKIKDFSSFLTINPYVLNMYRQKYFGYEVKYLSNLINMLYNLDINIKMSVVDKKNGLRMVFIDFFKGFNNAKR